MTGLGALIKRNTKLYFKDKGMFFTSLITPLILLVLYGTFLSAGIVSSGRKLHYCSVLFESAYGSG